MESKSSCFNLHHNVLQRVGQWRHGVSMVRDDDLEAVMFGSLSNDDDDDNAEDDA